MSSAPPLEITVVYSRSSRGRRRSGGYIGAGSQATALVKLGLLNLLVAGTLYYGTWWWADRDIQVKIITHTEFGGVGSDDLVEQLVPDRFDPGKPKTRSAARTKTVVAKAPTVEGLTSKGTVFVASLYGWELLSTVSICALALASGAMLKRGGTPMLRTVGTMIAAGMVCVLVWKVYSFWSRYGGYVPNEFRYGSAAAMSSALLFGLIFAKQVRRLTRLSAVLLILAAGGTVWGLHVGVQSNALDPKYAMPTYLAFAFAVHSAWGWILIPLAARMPR